MNNSKRQIQKEQTRDLLIESAITCFGKDGLLNAKTSDIAKLAGVAHGTVFVHFPTRDDLVSGAIHKVGRRVTEKIHELAEDGHSVREILEVHLKGLAETEDFYARLVTEGLSLGETAQNALIMVQSAISFHLMQAVEREKSHGTIREMPSHLLFNTWVGLIHYYLTNKKWFAPGESVLSRYGLELINHFLFLIKL